jgi:DNA-binding MarR family transcriptional regulator
LIANNPDLYLPVEGVFASGYYEVIALTERLHRQFLEVMKLELDGLGIHDINNAQGLMLFNIGDAEMTIGELILRGCYLGSNMSYSVKKMVESGYLAQERSVHDLRSIHVRLTEKGLKLRDRLLAMHQRHIEMLDQTAIIDEDLTAATATLRRPERFNPIRYRSLSSCHRRAYDVAWLTYATPIWLPVPPDDHRG